MRAALLLAILLLPSPGEAKGVKHFLRTLGEHVALGAGTEVAVSEVAGGQKKWAAGVVATGILAAVKEGSDVVAGRDTKKQAILHALEILGGAGVVSGVRH